MDEPIVADSALKHGLTRDAILHAVGTGGARRGSRRGSGGKKVQGRALTYSKLAWSADPKGQSLFTRCEHANASSIERRS